MRVEETGCHRSIPSFSRNRIRQWCGSRSQGRRRRAPLRRQAVSMCSRSIRASRRPHTTRGRGQQHHAHRDTRPFTPEPVHDQGSDHHHHQEAQASANRVLRHQRTDPQTDRYRHATARRHDHRSQRHRRRPGGGPDDGMKPHAGSEAKVLLLFSATAMIAAPRTSTSQADSRS